MSSTVRFTFKWPSAEPSEVSVTGSFDNWSKSIQLEKTTDGFEKTVDLSISPKNIHYKFVVDGDWKIDQMAAIEKDEHGNDNNVLTTDALSGLMLTSAAPQSTTAQLAAAVPLESSGPAEEKVEKPEETKKPEEIEHAVSVAPLPASIGNEPPASTAAVDHNVTLDKAGYDAPDNYAAQELSREEGSKASAEPEPEKQAVQDQAVSVAPLPASVGNEPPVSTAQLDSNVTLDKAGYDAPDNYAADELKNTSSEPAKPAEDEHAVSVAPIAASTGNEPPVSTANVDSNVTLDKEAYDAPDNRAAEELRSEETAAEASKPEPSEAPSQTVEPAFAVAPLPSTTDNKPSEVANQSVERDVTLDKDSYENATDATARQLLADLSIQDKSEETPKSDASEAGQPGAFTIQSVAPQSTTAALAAQVPLEPTAESTEAPKPAEEAAKPADEPEKAAALDATPAAQDTLKPAEPTEEARKKSGESSSPSDKADKKKKRRSIFNFLHDLIK